MAQLKTLTPCLGCAIALTLGTSFVWGSETANPAGTLQSEYDAFNQRLHTELRELDPEAEALLAQADAARDREDHPAASELYGKVFAKAPGFVPALRRQAGEESKLGHRSRGIALAEHAVELGRNVDNLAMLALILATSGPGSEPSRDELDRALGLAREALIYDHKNLFAHVTHAQVAIACSSLKDLDEEIAFLVDKVPNDKYTLVFRTVSAISHGDLTGARQTLEEAHRMGLPDEAYRSLSESIEKARPTGPRILRLAGLATTAWIGGGLVLLAVGMILSAVTLRQSGEVPADPNAGPTSFESRLRQLYRAVLAICCVYYYVSMPILFAVVLGLGGGLLYEMLSFGQLPIKLIVFVFIATVVTGWSIVKSLFVRRKQVDPGERLDLEREPAFRDMLAEVASKVGTRAVDTVFISPGTDVAVFERGGLARQLAGKSERCLILGAGVLEGMRLRPFEAVLAHEYGHFSNRDTAGGGLALSVRQSVVALATNLARNGAAKWYNPAWLFVNGFHRVFLRISQGASRLQEVLADRWAAMLYGASVFEEGLRHVIDRTVRFNAHVNATIKEVIEAGRPLANIYGYKPSSSDAAGLDAAVESAINREPSPYDSHPSPADRFRWVHALQGTGGAPTDDSATVWGLFRDRASIEERMTGVIRANVAAQHGIKIASHAR